MKRKVVKHGPSTLIISIPSGWAKKYSVKQGDELDVDEQGSRLIIDNKGEKQLPEINMDISGLKPKMIRRFYIFNINYQNYLVMKLLREQMRVVLLRI